MDRYFTVMVIPEKDKKVRSFRIPRLVFHSITFIVVVLIFVLGILAYDYSKILMQINKNKHLTIENRQLKEQIQLFQMKINTLAEDIERIHTFEKKLRIITGVDDKHHLKLKSQLDTSRINIDSLKSENEIDHTKQAQKSENEHQTDKSSFNQIKEKLRTPEKSEKYINLKNLYDQKIATSFGLQTGYAYTKEWNDLTKQSFELANQFALFDYKYNEIKSFVKDLELDIHELDQFLLDKDSFLRSTPTLIPTKGWITSYYGPRRSPTSNRIKMHEGLDVGAKSGTPILAPADGVITFSGVKPGFGNFVQIDHGYGVETIFAHARKLIAKKGQKIKRGELLAMIGSTGHSTGPHLHYEVRINGTPVDPLYFILD
jgi:murein DD-endopeptidase MepM/ murein hydrolase activator NlpD